MKPHILALLLIGAILLSACQQAQAPTSQQGPVCNKPYILVGVDCCLDQNDNSICDKDEAPSTNPPTVIIQPPTQTETKEDVITTEILSISPEKPGPTGMHGNFVRFVIYVNGYLRSYNELCSQKECSLYINLDDGSNFDINYVGSENGHDSALYACYMSAPDNYPAWIKRPCLEQLYDGKHNVNMHFNYNGKEIVAWKYLDFDTELT
jgi:hypothetical protein